MIQLLCSRPMVTNSEVATASPVVRSELKFSTKKDRLESETPPPAPCKGTAFLPDSPVAAVVLTFDGEQHRHTAVQSKFYNPSLEASYFDQSFTNHVKIGQGSFADVFKCRSKEDGNFYAVKKVFNFKSLVDRKVKRDEVRKNIQVPSHPNIVKFIIAWEELQTLYIQTELCVMSMHDIAETNHFITEPPLWIFIHDVAEALAHLHSHDMMHLDVKPANVFVTTNNVFKLGDFGLLASTQKKAIELEEGDSRYVAPEFLQNGDVSCCSDMFSFGLSVLELATDLDLPSCGVPWHQLRNSIFPEDRLSQVSSELRLVIKMLTEPERSDRPTAQQILSEPFIREKHLKRAETNAIFDELVGAVLEERRTKPVRLSAISHEQRLLFGPQKPSGSKRKNPFEASTSSVLNSSFELDDPSVSHGLVQFPTSSLPRNSSFQLDEPGPVTPHNLLDMFDDAASMSSK